ncbi:MAG: CDP-alcohol phosphatidyltransferase family protein [Desulfocapsa sp.]|nr:CDP-alcohol phosphatidyltransferase family protein [Desulfocapsa sp.]
MTINKNKIVNVPNFLTLLRFLMIGVMVWFFLNSHPIYAMYVYMGAVFTDLLDGVIARKFNMVTNLGKLIDPLADKFLQFAAVFCFFWIGYLPIIPFILIVLNEILMVYGASFMFLKKHTVMSANLFGKIAAGLFYAAILTTFLHEYTAPFDLYAMYLSIAIIYASLIQYWYITVGKRRRDEDEDAEAEH